MAQNYSRCVSFTSSTVSTSTLTQGWKNQHEVISRFLKQGWLTTRTAGWIRETEITHSNKGWHVHSHWLLFLETDDQHEHQKLVTQLTPHWLDSARQLGIGASPRGQYAEVRTDVLDSLRYVTKGQMKAARHDGRHTLGDLLRAFQAGDADAADLWSELEDFSQVRRRWSASGGSFRSRS